MDPWIPVYQRGDQVLHKHGPLDWSIIYSFTSRTYMETSPLPVKGCKIYRPMLGAQGLWAGRDPYRATPAVTGGLGFSGLIRSRRTAPFCRLLRHTTRCGGPTLTRILTGTRTPDPWIYQRWDQVPRRVIIPCRPVTPAMSTMVIIQTPRVFFNCSASASTGCREDRRPIRSKTEKKGESKIWKSKTLKGIT
jgi:hypothetical protein